MLISVILSIYGNFDTKRLSLSLTSTVKQTLPVEVVIAEVNPMPTVESLAKQLGVKYVYHSSNESCPGFARNLAVLHSTGDYIYGTDADLLYPVDYFNQLSKLSDCTWIHPIKRRLPKKQFDIFAQHGDASKLFIQEFFVSTTDVEIPYMKREKNDRTFTAIKEDYESWSQDTLLRPYAPAIWVDTRHFGGTFSARENWLKVGCYCEDYMGWGYEDTDIQWKLSTITNVVRLPAQESLSLIHLDHDKKYFDPIQFNANKNHFLQRKLNTNSILSDINTWKHKKL